MKINSFVFKKVPLSASSNRSMQVERLQLVRGLIYRPSSRALSDTTGGVKLLCSQGGRLAESIKIVIYPLKS